LATSISKAERARQHARLAEIRECRRWLQECEIRRRNVVEHRACLEAERTQVSRTGLLRIMAHHVA
jgi:hypothetical protein